MPKLPDGHDRKIDNKIDGKIALPIGVEEMPNPIKGGTRSFSENLLHYRREKDWSQSELARKIWGETTDARGYTVARNRDRISSYERGQSIPEKDNLEKIAEALGVAPETLAPELSGEIAGKRGSNVSMRILADGQVHLEINTITSLALASELVALISGAQASDKNKK